MAKKTTVSLIDDLDGSKADRTVAFGWEGKSYEIDLSKRNAAALEKAITSYLAVARRAGVVAPRTAPRRAATAGVSNSAVIRDWARQNGFPNLGDRGRIPAAVEEAFATANA